MPLAVAPIASTSQPWHASLSWKYASPYAPTVRLIRFQFMPVRLIRFQFVQFLIGSSPADSSVSKRARNWPENRWYFGQTVNKSSPTKETYEHFISKHRKSERGTGATAWRKFSSWRSA